MEIAKDITAKFNHSNSFKKSEFLFIYADYVKVEVLKHKFEMKRCEKNIKLVKETEISVLENVISTENLLITEILTENFELIFGDFTVDESHLSEDLFLSDLSDETIIVEEVIVIEEIIEEEIIIEEKIELPKRVLFPVSWNQMIENKRNSLKKMIDKSVVVTPSSFENKFSLKDCDLEDISPDEHSFDFKTPENKKQQQNSDRTEFAKKKNKNKKKCNDSQTFYF